MVIIMIFILWNGPRIGFANKSKKMKSYDSFCGNCKVSFILKYTQYQVTVLASAARQDTVSCQCKYNGNRTNREWFSWLVCLSRVKFWFGCIIISHKSFALKRFIKKNWVKISVLNLNFGIIYFKKFTAKKRNLHFVS